MAMIRWDTSPLQGALRRLLGPAFLAMIHSCHPYWLPGLELVNWSFQLWDHYNHVVLLQSPGIPWPRSRRDPRHPWNISKHAFSLAARSFHTTRSLSDGMIAALEAGSPVVAHCAQTSKRSCSKRFFERFMEVAEVTSMHACTSAAVATRVFAPEALVSSVPAPRKNSLTGRTMRARAMLCCLAVGVLPT
ncbi:hypothetical protein C8R44DRAFT_861617 [Mycena epipterygia]|nr:hypothetical protein C8R44DRAFT_861617 [Mycena epipterygia]